METAPSSIRHSLTPSAWKFGEYLEKDYPNEPFGLVTRLAHFMRPR